jgi:hypothetical protein
MTGRTEERLRDATRALGRSIGPQDIPDLRLPVSDRRQADGHGPWRASGSLAGSRWLIPGAAAVTVALIISLIVIGRTLTGTRQSSPPAELVRDMPAYRITDRYGHGYVQATASGRVVARIRPPVPGFLVEGIAVLPGDRTFYLAGEIPFAPPRVKVEFFKYTLSARGQPGPPQRLGAPLIERVPQISNGLTAIPLAISADGKELAYASPFQVQRSYTAHHPAAITVQDVATGSRRTWSFWPGWGTSVDSLSFTAGNRLGFVAVIGGATVSNGAVVRQRASDLDAFMILNLAAPGSSLIAGSRLVTYDSAWVGQPDVTTPLGGPATGILAPDGRSAYLLILAYTGFNRLVRISVSTGKVTDVIARTSVKYDGFPTAPAAIDGNQMLIWLPPRHRNASNVFNSCAYLAAVNLTTLAIKRLPAPSWCLQYVWYTGSFHAAW